VLERLRTDRVILADSALALLLFGLGFWEVVAEPLEDDVVEGPLALNLVALGLSTLPIAARRRAPLAAAATVFGAIAVRALVADPLEIYPPFLAGLVVVYSVAAYASARSAVLGAALSAAAVAVAAARGSGGDAAPALVPALILLGVVWGLGRVVGARYSSARAIERRAAERDRRAEAEARAAVAAERERIARELHDAVSHSLALIAMQAGGAQAILRREPGRAEQSLHSIERAAREGLTEMRRLLGLMGTDSAQGDLSPQGGIDQVGAIVERARDAGLEVELRVEGEPRALPPGIDLSAYRIVQEALTNAVKHAGRCHAAVSVRWRPGAVELEITNDGASGSSDLRRSAGRGLIGMRERAALVGGELEVGPTEDGTFRVWSRLPLEARP
jgi:signal transduction histidine kinase